MVCHLSVLAAQNQTTCCPRKRFKEKSRVEPLSGFQCTQTFGPQMVALWQEVAEPSRRWILGVWGRSLRIRVTRCMAVSCLWSTLYFLSHPSQRATPTIIARRPLPSPCSPPQGFQLIARIHSSLPSIAFTSYNQSDNKCNYHYTMACPELENCLSPCRCTDTVAPGAGAGLDHTHNGTSPPPP